jgi:putative transposase
MAVDDGTRPNRSSASCARLSGCRPKAPRLVRLPEQLEISEQTFHRWRNQFGGMKADDANRLKKELERENARLKRIMTGPQDHNFTEQTCGSDNEFWRTNRASHVWLGAGSIPAGLIGANSRVPRAEGLAWEKYSGVVPSLCASQRSGWSEGPVAKSSGITRSTNSSRRALPSAGQLAMR